MGTRAIYTFEDNYSEVNIFIHYDGYPAGAAEYLAQWLGSEKSWPLPRFEADEAAAGFVAATKTRAGNVRIMPNRTAASDVEFGYRIGMKNGKAWIQAAETDYWDETPSEHVFFDGLLSAFIDQHQQKVA
jgi:hypothetical protein